jgi:transcription antitermination factor NusA-like protein
MSNELNGKRIRIIHMDDKDPVPSNTEGTIHHVDGIGQIHVKWDNGRTLAVVPDKDTYEILT